MLIVALLGIEIDSKNNRGDVVLLIMWVDNFNVVVMYAGGGKTIEKTYCRE